MADIRLTYYGDDFTGSTDVMEALEVNGVHCVLFLEPPTIEELEQYPGIQAVGVAGVSRSMTPEEMQQELPPIWKRIHALNAPLFHYKVCSTFDSSAETGSIGCAIEIGGNLWKRKVIPLVVGAPKLGRYVVFRNLFARSGFNGDVYRLDQHPTMRHHPVTPMRKSDLRSILADQGVMGFEEINILALDQGIQEVRRRIEACDCPNTVLVFDTLTDAHLPTIGEALWEGATHETPLFAVGSSGIEYALTAHWNTQQRPATSVSFRSAGEQQVLVMSGSCSPVTERQIATAEQNGFVVIALDTLALLDEATREQTLLSTIDEALPPLLEGKSMVIHSCCGREDVRLSATKLAIQGLERGALGKLQGRLLRQLLMRFPMRRVAVTGGDTSGYVAQELGILSLQMVRPMSPGSPLCKMHSTYAELDGVEILFKGGQVGRDDLFVAIGQGSVEK